MSQDFDKEAWERGKTLFQEDLGQAKGKEHRDYFSMIDFAVDGYACLSAPRIYSDNPTLRDWAFNGYRLMWRWHAPQGSRRRGAHGREFMMTYYFDVLPLHPRPEYLESLTSYLMRLAELNGISSIDGLSALCFPHQDRRITRDIADYPPLSFGDLTRVGAWSEEMLRTTTFFHLAAKFGRSTLPQPMSRFLSGCVSQYFRYCPVCLAEQQVRHYLLIWRFPVLTCCYKHRCRLLEICGHCSELLPLFTSPFRLGKCPRCQQSLKLCTAHLIFDEAELEATVQVHNDIVFLLTPQPWEADGDRIIRCVGRRFAYVRQMKQLTAVEVSSKIGVTLTMIEGIERGDIQGRGAMLQGYFKYARCLGLNLRTIFSDVIDFPDNVPVISLPVCPICQQSHSVIRYGYNRSGSQRYQCQRCYHSFTACPKTRIVTRRCNNQVGKVTGR